MEQAWFSLLCSKQLPFSNSDDGRLSDCPKPCVTIWNPEILPGIIVTVLKGFCYVSKSSHFGLLVQSHFGEAKPPCDAPHCVLVSMFSQEVHVNVLSFYLGEVRGRLFTKTQTKKQTNRKKTDVIQLQVSPSGTDRVKWTHWLHKSLSIISLDWKDISYFKNV